MEFTPEFITEQKFTPEQVTAITANVTGHYEPHIATLKKGWDDTATKNAEAIISGAITATQEANNFTLARDEGEKLKDWQVRFSAKLNEGVKAEAIQSKADHDELIKNFKGDPDLVKKIGALEVQVDPLLKAKAEYDKIVESGVVGKYEALLIKDKATSKALAYGSVKPAFHKDIDPRVISYEWDRFVNDVEAKYDLTQVNNEWVGAEKGNPHAQKSLKDLVKGNEDLTKLIDGRKQEGFNPDEADVSTVEGVPFGVPKDVSNKDLTDLVHTQLKIEGLEKLGSTAAEYSKRFKKLFAKARGQETAE